MNLQIILQNRDFSKSHGSSLIAASLSGRSSLTRRFTHGALSATEAFKMAAKCIKWTLQRGASTPLNLVKPP
jgi:hypothetical protein